jgi:Protein of unknown function (DUF2796)
MAPTSEHAGIAAMRGGTIAWLVATLGVAGANAQERRELSAHEHGHSALNIAVEGSVVAMELLTPGRDIVGFEHAATTDEQRAAVEEVKAALADPLALFVPPEAAGCQLTEATVALDTDAEEGAGVAAAAAGEENQAEFHGVYTLSCADPSALDSISFVYFDRFPSAEEVEVMIIDERGQTTYEVERASPRLVLDGAS